MILFEENTLQETIEKNAENLKIAELNLLDFNKRMDKDYDLICKFTNENPRFFLKQELRYPENTNTIASQINWLLTWKKEKHHRDYFKIFFGDVQRDFEEINIYHSPYIQKSSLYYKIVDKFKKKYTDYAPLGFLNEDDESFIKKEIYERFLKHLE